MTFFRMSCIRVVRECVDEMGYARILVSTFPATSVSR